jgi:hypothetical protein
MAMGPNEAIFRWYCWYQREGATLHICTMMHNMLEPHRSSFGKIDSLFSKRVITDVGEKSQFPMGWRL